MSYRMDIADFLDLVDYPSTPGANTAYKKEKTTALLPEKIAIEQEVINDHLRVVSLQYTTKQTMTLDCLENDPFLELHFNLSPQAIPYKNSFSSSKEVPPMTGNMIYLASTGEKSELSFQKGVDYETFDIHLPLSMISQYAGEHRQLDYFLNQITLAKSAGLTENCISITPSLYHAIQQIKQCSFEGLTRKIYLESKIYEILAYCFEEQIATQTVKLTTRDIESIHFAAHIIQSNISHPLTIEEISKKVGINQTKLKLGFKQLYGTTIFGYLQELRMNQAQKYLLNTADSIEEISIKCGYINTSNFSNAFKKHFGYAPSRCRQNNSIPRSYPTLNQ
ncbi:helix-turn-helix transcriptional regulator [Myroides sp. TSA_177.3]|uniref:helix-turn-helix transcriptional regulator n=1 Tax=Myroides sp. TSA_177.3 TaxID=3415650 RepID=UPI0040451F92